MKQRGIIRKLDKLGRIVIPMEARRELSWGVNVPIDITPFGRYILLHAHSDELIASVAEESPIRLEIASELNTLSDADLLLILDMVHRLAQPTSASASGESN